MSESHADDTGEHTDKTEHADKLEYPDQAGYPDGMGTLDEGTRTNEAAKEAVEEIDDFAEHDVEDE